MKLTQKEVDAMVAAGKLNREKLESCERHFFMITGVLQQHVVCSKCNGRVQTSTAYAYAAGYVHADGLRTDVLWEDF